MRPRWFVAAIVALFVAVALLLFYAVPPLMTRGEEFKSAADRLKAENDIRTAGLQLLAGAVLAFGAVFTGITLVFNREGQITERFTRAVEQLGNERTDVRLGGIYALERIARDSRRDHEPIMEILSAYAREASRRHGPLARSSSTLNCCSCAHANIRSTRRPESKRALSPVAKRMAANPLERTRARP